MTTPLDRVASGWEDAGARVAPALAGVSAVVVAGRDVEATARAAIGLARAEARRRRVAVADLIGDAPALVALVDGDDPHGIVDSFLYGVSLNRVARPVRGEVNLFVLPSGTEPVVTEEIFRSDRWRRLAGGFREVGALLLLVAPADAPGLEALVDTVDGVVAVDDADGWMASRFPVVALVDGWRPTTRMDAIPSEPLSGPIAREPGSRGPTAHAARRGTVVLPPQDRQAPRWLVPALLVLAAAGGAGGWLWQQQRRAAVPVAATRPAPARDTAPAAAPDTAPAATVPDTLPMLSPLNPADSARAAAFVIEVAKVSTEEGARQTGMRSASTLPTASAFPVLLGNDRSVWYRVAGGGWRTRAEADSALAAFNRAGVSDVPATVVRAPLALLVGNRLSADSARIRIQRYAMRGIPVHALRQDDGSLNLYAGAFETPDQSMLLAAAVQRGGDVPALVYRTGRP